MNKVWLVRFDGYIDGSGYGNVGYLLGIYDEESKAFAAAERLGREHVELASQVFIHPVVVNTTYEVTERDNYEEFITDIYLGGWSE